MVSISLLLEMVRSANPDRVAVVSGETRWTTDQFIRLADGGAMLPRLILAAARANRPLPLNYRLAASALRELIARLRDPLVVFDEEYADVVWNIDRAVFSHAFVEQAETAEPAVEFADPDDVAVMLFTSGTTAKPKAVELTRGNLTRYVTSRGEFDSAEPHDVALVAVPPYHIAGVGSALSHLYAGRKVVYQTKCDAAEWLRLAAAVNITTAIVVPTMRDRIIGELDRSATVPGSLRNLAYGGSKTPLPLIRRALDRLPKVGFVNAY